MTRFTAGLVASSLFLGVLATPASAQKQDIKVRGYFGVGGGLAPPVSDYRDGTKTGYELNLIGGFTTRGGIFGARADLMWAENGIKVTDGNVRLIGLNADIVLTPGHRPNNFHPYFLAGGGLYHVRSSGASLTTSTETKPAVNFGVGLQVHTGHQIDLFVEGRYLTVLTSGTNSTLVPISFGVRWGGI